MNHTKTIGILVASLTFSLSRVTALDIVFTDVGSSTMSGKQLAAFEAAAAIWMSLFDDPITVQVDIAFENLSSGILGSTSTARTTSSYSTVYKAMLADAGSTNEERALEGFPSTSVPIMDVNGDRDDDEVTLSTANAKALGLGTGLDPTYANPPVGVDAEITFNTDYEDDFDYDRSDGIDSEKADFVAVAAHELGHALGFLSLTDIQDYYDTYTLHPNTLDLWRFPVPFATPDEGHDLDDRRCVTSWFSDFYSDDAWHARFSLGSYAYLTDYACNASTGYCQASHWSDDRGNLMDPTLGPGYQQDVEDEDVHAIDYIGYDAAVSPRHTWDLRGVVAWYRPGSPLGGFGSDFESYPAPPPESEVPHSATATIAVRLGLALNLGGGVEKLRSALGHARFRPSVAIEQSTVVHLPHVPGEQNLLPAGRPLSSLPPALYEVILVTEATAGARLTFRSADSTSGALFDASIGEFGGYRIAGFVDGAGDGVDGDIDGVMTLVLAAEGPRRDGDDIEGIVLVTSSDSVLNVRDRAALGMTTAFRRGDANGDSSVTMSDAIATLNVLFLGLGRLDCREAADSNDDGQVSIADSITTLSVLFLGTGSIPAPGTQQCGEDPTADDLDCSSEWSCR